MPTTTAPLTFGHPSRCVRTIARGCVKRVLVRGPHLVGYQIACAACGYPGSYLHTEADFTEGPWITDRAPAAPGGPPLPFERVATLEMARAVLCFGCRGMLRVTGGEVVVEPPANA